STPRPAIASKPITETKPDDAPQNAPLAMPTAARARHRPLAHPLRHSHGPRATHKPSTPSAPAHSATDPANVAGDAVVRMAPEPDDAGFRRVLVRPSASGETARGGRRPRGPRA